MSAPVQTKDLLPGDAYYGWQGSNLKLIIGIQVLEVEGYFSITYFQVSGRNQPVVITVLKHLNDNHPKWCLFISRDSSEQSEVSR